MLGPPDHGENQGRYSSNPRKPRNAKLATMSARSKQRRRQKPRSEIGLPCLLITAGFYPRERPSGFMWSRTAPVDCQAGRIVTIKSGRMLRTRSDFCRGISLNAQCASPGARGAKPIQGLDGLKRRSSVFPVTPRLSAQGLQHPTNSPERGVGPCGVCRRMNENKPTSAKFLRRDQGRAIG